MWDFAAWERLLSSDIAIALLLLLATLTLARLFLASWREMQKENRELRRELVDYLKSDADVTRIVEQHGALMDLVDRRRAAQDPPDPTAIRAAPPGT